MMQSGFTLEQYDEAANFIRSHTKHQPTIGLVLGSGLAPLAERIEQADLIPYAEIPHFPVSTAPGHVGRLVIGQLSGVAVCVMQGRFHFYEGYSLTEVTLPIWVMARLGIKTVILTTASGGVNPTFEVGDLMVIDDHINLLTIGGQNPLKGSKVDPFELQFPTMKHTYTRRLRQLADTVAAEQGLRLRHGVYLGLSGPSFETPAEIRMARALGADAVAMSTVNEAMVAGHAGLEVLAISTIANRCIDVLDSDTEPTHEEVMEAGKVIVPRLTQLLIGVLAKLSEQASPA